MKNNQFHLIKPNKDIILHCNDFMGDYKVEGRFMMPSKGHIKNVFCTFDENLNKWVKDSKHWNQRNEWEYK